MAEELQTYLLEHFQWLHRHPELALKEYETTNYVKNVLKQTEGVELLNLGLDTGALAKIEGKEPGGVVAIRADIDALPWHPIPFTVYKNRSTAAENGPGAIAIVPTGMFCFV